MAAGTEGVLRLLRGHDACLLVDVDAGEVEERVPPRPGHRVHIRAVLAPPVRERGLRVVELVAAPLDGPLDLGIGRGVDRRVRLADRAEHLVRGALARDDHAVEGAQHVGAVLVVHAGGFEDLGPHLAVTVAGLGALGLDASLEADAAVVERSCADGADQGDEEGEAGDHVFERELLHDLPFVRGVGGVVGCGRCSEEVATVRRSPIEAEPRSPVEGIIVVEVLRQHSGDEHLEHPCQDENPGRGRDGRVEVLVVGHRSTDEVVVDFVRDDVRDLRRVEVPESLEAIADVHLHLLVPRPGHELDPVDARIHGDADHDGEVVLLGTVVVQDPVLAQGFGVAPVLGVGEHYVDVDLAHRAEVGVHLVEARLEIL